MPTVVNGIGTWYYGKKRILKRKGTCEHCQRLVELESYDTTLFFVVVFIPVIPLVKNRILDQCTACRRHRIIALKKWEQAKAKDVALLMEKLQNDPDNRDNILHALQLATVYQDEPLFVRVAQTLAADRVGDLGIQTQLAQAYAYFGRWPEAEQALRACLALKDDNDLREQLGWALLKQGMPEQARPCFEHILAARNHDSAGQIYWLINGYQAAGLHEDALELMDQRDDAFPGLAKTPAYVKQRKTSVRYQGSGKPVRHAFLAESNQIGYQEGNWTARLPYAIPIVLVLGALIAYFGSALWIGQSRKVYLVNGSDKPYNVAVNGKDFRLEPAVAVAARLPEGDVTIEFSDAKGALEPVHTRVESSFWSRPFLNRTFVINPDQLAPIVWEESIYSEKPAPIGKHEIHVGEALHTFSGIDYEFEPFPASLQAKKGQTITKTRISVIPITAPFVRQSMMQQEMKGPQQQTEYAKRVLRFDPDNELFLNWLINAQDSEDVIRFLRGRLADRPIRVDWHRSYQSVMDKAHPETDLRPEYQKLVAETKDDPDALYLLGRVESEEESEKLYRRSAEANPPCSYAFYGLGYRALAQGRFADAVRWMGQANKMMPNNLPAQALFQDCLLANREYDRLIELLEVQKRQPEMSLPRLWRIIETAIIKGDLERAKAATDELLQVYSHEPPASRAKLNAELEIDKACCSKDAKAYVKAVGEHPEWATVESMLLQSKLQEAVQKIGAEEKGDVASQHALIYLAAIKAKDTKLADSQWNAFLKALEKEGKDQRLLADALSGRKPFSADDLRKLSIDPGAKRVYLAAAAKDHPKEAKELLDLARKLDFHRDAVSLLLQELLN